jgi:dTMP kinase
MSRAGRLIAFEGTEGAGKTTQISRAAEVLRRDGHRVEVTLEPGGTALGRALRGLLLHGDDAPRPLAELFLYLADRAQHVDQLIEPALAAGALVITDRFSQGFHAQAAADPAGWRVIDATLPEHTVHEQVLAAIRACLAPASAAQRQSGAPR